MSYVCREPDTQKRRDTTLASFGQAIFNCGVLEALAKSKESTIHPLDGLDRRFLNRAREIVESLGKDINCESESEGCSLFPRSLQKGPVLLADAEELKRKALLEALRELASKNEMSNQELRATILSVLQAISEGNPEPEDHVQLTFEFFILYSNKALSPYVRNRT